MNIILLIILGLLVYLAIFRRSVLWGWFKTVLKNLIPFILGGIGGFLIASKTIIPVALGNIVEQTGLGIIALGPLAILFLGGLSFIVGGIIGIIIYNVVKRWF